MDTSGKPHEGWMTVIPVSVFLFIVVVALGGPAAFVNVVTLWVTDIASYVVGWIKHL
jgi:hypothetical protein